MAFIPNLPKQMVMVSCYGDLCHKKYPKYPNFKTKTPQKDLEKNALCALMLHMWQLPKHTVYAACLKIKTHLLSHLFSIALILFRLVGSLEPVDLGKNAGYTPTWASFHHNNTVGETAKVFDIFTSVQFVCKTSFSFIYSNHLPSNASG